MTTPRVVHVTTTAMSLDWLLRPQLEAFAAAGYDVIAMSAPDDHVGAIEASGIDHVGAIEASGIDHVAIPALTRSVSPGGDARALRQLQRAFRAIAPDIVHTHNPKPGVLGRIAARRAGVPVVVNTVHGLYATADDAWLRRRIVHGLERMAATWSDAELVQNVEDLELLRALGVPDSKLTLLGNGIDLARFDPSAVSVGTRARIRSELGVGDDTVLVGAVGRLVWEKGYREIFAAAELLEDLNCRFVVVGPDDEAKASSIGDGARAAARQLGVVFAGCREDMPEIYSALDMFVLASYREGFPRSAMEASAMGVPVIATDIRGCRQVVVDGETGHLFPAGDAAALAEAVSGLVVDPVRRREMGDEARARALVEFDDRRVIATTLDTYDWLLGARSPMARVSAVTHGPGQRGHPWPGSARSRRSAVT
jgi:glycosyltransferase involved in cell wall biosynthesis